MRRASNGLVLLVAWSQLLFEDSFAGSAERVDRFGVLDIRACCVTDCVRRCSELTIVYDGVLS